MSRGRKRRRKRKISTPKGHVVERRRDTGREQEFLNSEVRQDGVGEDQFVQALIYELPNATEAEAKEIAFAVQQRLRGDASLLDSPELSDTLEGIRLEAAEIDNAADAWARSEQGFIDDAFRRAPKLTDKQKEQLSMKGKRQWKDSVTYLKAGKHVKQLQMRDRLPREPLEEIHVMGRPAVIGGRRRLLPVDVRIMGMSFKLVPGIHKVPRTVAETYREMLKQQAYADAKRVLWSGQDAPMTSGGYWDVADIDRQLAELSDQYGVKREDFYTS